MKDMTNFAEKLEACRVTGFPQRHLPALLRTAPPEIQEVTLAILIRIMRDIMADPRSGVLRVR